jgi:hypothetical protein
MKISGCQLFFLALIFSCHAAGQIRRDAIWCFGDSARIDFNQSPPEVSSCSVRARGTCCSITDSLGNMLFYCNTFYYPLWSVGYYRLGVVWNKNDEVMENGDSLIGEGWYNEMVICPLPDSPNFYILFHSDIALTTGIYYSIIDMSYNNGLGKVVQKNVQLDSLNGRYPTDGITAIKHGNGRDWWIVFRTYDNGITSSNTFYKYLLTPNGISSTTQSIGTLSAAGFLFLKFNHSGKKLLAYTNIGLLELIDFDRCSGLFSNPLLIHYETSNYDDSYYGAEFSPNDSVLYVSSGGPTSYLYQFNLTSSNIFNSKWTLSTLAYPAYAAGHLKSALDGKIYFSRWYYDGLHFPFAYPDTTYNIYNTNLSVINNPNQLGSGCDFQAYSFYLEGKRTYVGLPNNPNYDMEALGGTICDSLGLPNSVSEVFSQNQLSVFYHSEWQSAFINASGLIGNNFTLHIISVDGKEAYSESCNLNSGFFTKSLNCSTLSKGIYLVLIETEVERIIKKFIIN